jgi:hypothetical protein
MMTNGVLQYKITEGGGIDEETGNAIPVVESWSNPIDALITPNSNGNLKKYQDGEQVAASYTILLELQDFKHVTIRLIDSIGESLGEYQVLAPNIRRMETVGRIKITV